MHLLEGPSYALLRTLSKLSQHDDFSSSSSSLQSGNIIYSIEDRMKRIFPEWYSCTINDRKAQNEDLTEENCKDVVFELTQKILKIGEGLQSESNELDITR